MQLKEVLNLRKLKEEFYDNGTDCHECPFYSVCQNINDEYRCMVRRIFEDTEFSDDLYEMEEKGTLENDYQIDYRIDHKENGEW